MPLLFIVLGLFLIAVTIRGKLQIVIDQLFSTNPNAV